ncbi:2-polyprenylphenol 6-hydroxylase [bacterium]|nr:2-polyprenylphenol 6-hydroxylase [bacterium]
MLPGITQKIHNIQRLRQILQVLVKYGFGYIVDRLHIEQNIIGRRFVKLKSIKKLDVFNQPAPVRARKVLEELGPTFIKLGQILSTRPDLIPLEFCKEFEKLQDEAPAIEYEKVKAQIENEFKQPINKIFNNFSSQPVAAASLAEVHLAELKTGEKVVVKVQRPDIRRMITADLEILYGLAKLAEKHIKESRIYDPVGVVEEFKKTILKEIDFNVEANNIERFRRNFKDDDIVYVPEVFRDLSTAKILTIERIEGIKVSDIEKIEESGLDRKQIAINGANAVLKQIFIHGFFHADPHPGNIFVLDNNRIAFVDYGMVGRLDEETKVQFASILTAVVERDVSGVIESLIATGVVEEADVKRLSLDLEELMDRYYGIPLKELEMGQFLMDAINVVSQNKIKIPPSLFLLSKALITIEGVGRKLDPEFNVAIHIKPFVGKLVREKYSPKRIAKELRGFAKELYVFASSFPKDLSLIFNKIKKGNLKVEFEHKGLENLISQMDKVSNRIAFSVIIAALIIGSSIIMQTNKGPLFLGFPVLGIFGFLIAGILGLWLVIAILRSGRL